MERRRFPRDIAALGALHEFSATFLTRHGFDPDGAFDVDLLLEELFTNMVKYNREGREEIEVSLDAKDGTVTIVLRDFGVASFDVTEAPEVDTDMPLSERRRGGLGLHLVRQIADSVDYEYKNRNSTITVTKRLES